MHETCTDITTSNHQPTIIIIHDAMNIYKIEQLLIKVDHQTLNYQETNLVKCLDYFFKIFWIFNLAYASQTRNLMYFFEMVFEMETCSNSVKEFHRQIFE